MSEFANRLLDNIKINLRETSTEFDNEIAGYIDACSIDLQNSGILPKFFEVDLSDPNWQCDPQIQFTIRTFCLMSYGLYNTDMEKYKKIYLSLKTKLCTMSKYTTEVVDGV